MLCIAAFATWCTRSAIKLHNPEKLDATTGRMLATLFQTIVQAREDDDVRVIVLARACRKFCSGADTEMYVALAQG
ncbi:MAG: enoyl-CoA hydratase/isomerase family protein [Deltaproteobacteria bacterium]|nr:enoyl-CoA hydratase/isomerase family protein [Deltaproteobacteria bacterium]